MRRTFLGQAALLGLTLAISGATPGRAQQIFDFDFETVFPTYGFTFGYAGWGDSTCTINTDSGSQVLATFDINSPPEGTATFDTSGWTFASDACYTYAGWALATGYSLPPSVKLDSGNLADYTLSFDAAVDGSLFGLDAQLYIVFQLPDSDGDGNLDDHRWGYDGSNIFRPFLTDVPQTFSFNVGDFPFISSQGTLDFANDFADTITIQVIVQPEGNDLTIGVDSDNVLRLDNVRLDGPTITQPGDFNGDGFYDCTDINALIDNIANGPADPATYDLTGDGNVDLADRDAWLLESGEANLGPGRGYLLGDATLDGNVDGSDFGEWNANKFTNTAAWCAGDFNADGAVDGSDFGDWNGNKFTSADGVSAIPEPAAVVWLMVGLLWCAGRRAI